MRRQIGWAVLLVVLALTTVTQAAGTVVVTTSESIPGVRVYTIAWTSDAAGAVTGNASSGWGLTYSLDYPLRGRLRQVKFIPGSGATQPTDLYDATIVDSSGASLLVVDSVDYGANLSNAAPKILTLSQPILLDATKTIDVRIANGGNAKTGTVQLWIERE